MSLLNAIGGASGSVAPKLNASDVFSTYLYTGNGTTQTITNGIDLAGQGGMVWIKNRSSAIGHALFDSIRTSTSHALFTNTAGIQVAGYDVSFANNGFSLGHSEIEHNASANNYASWTFRKAPKFFDVVTYTGDGVAGRQIPHNLGCEVGMMVVKCTSVATAWNVYHRNLTSAQYQLELNTTSAQFADSTMWNDTAPTSSNFTIGSNLGINGTGRTYVAYLFAHDTSTDGIIQCGNVVYSLANGNNVNLGFEPQYLMYRYANAADNWNVIDIARGWTSPAKNARLLPNSSDAEALNSQAVTLTSTGFNLNAGWLSDGVTVIYMAIRRPNKVPTSGTEVYNAIARTGTGAVATISGVGFAPDSFWNKARASSAYGSTFDRLRGNNLVLNLEAGSSEASVTDTVNSFNMDGVTLGTDPNNWAVNNNTRTTIGYFFKRAKGFFDIVCHTGTGALLDVNHSLGVAPELCIQKARNEGTLNWRVWTPTMYGQLNLTDSFGTTTTVSTGTTFRSFMSTAGVNFVTYLFATLAGVSKIGSYTGNGTSQTINCGFTGGARFVLIKRTDSTGDWYVWDTVRGIVAGNDPHLSLNTTAAEVTTDDTIDPESTGFIVNQVAATNVNVNLATYIYLAIS